MLVLVGTMKYYCRLAIKVNSEFIDNVHECIILQNEIASVFLKNRTFQLKEDLITCIQHVSYVGYANTVDCEDLPSNLHNLSRARGCYRGYICVKIM